MTFLAAGEDKAETLRNVLEGVYQTSVEGGILAANPALVEMLGYESEEELRTNANAAQIYMDPAERQRFLARLRAEGASVHSVPRRPAATGRW